MNFHFLGLRPTTILALSIVAYVGIFCTAVHADRRIANQKTKPVITTAPQPQTVLYKGTVVLYCKGHGSAPGLKIKWFRGQRELTGTRFDVFKSSERRSSSVGDDDSTIVVYSTIWLREVKKSKEFECRISNEHGQATALAQLTVIDEELRPSGFPQILNGPLVKTVEKKRDETMSCLTTGQPPPHVVWYKGEFPLVTRPGRVQVGRTGTLTIMNSTEEDEGKYTCVASNSVGTAVSDSGTLYVRERRENCEIKTGPHKFYEVMPGEGLNITCAAAGYPMPTVTWYQHMADGLEAVSESVQGINILHLRDIQASNNFTCIATSKLNNDTATTELRLQVLPEAPIEVKVINVTNHSARLEWRYEWRGGVESSSTSSLHYTIYYRPIGLQSGNNTELAIRHVTSQRYTIEGLLPYTRYLYRVSATNRVGESDKSDGASAKTLEAAPGQPPASINALLTTRMTPTEVFLDFERPATERNGEIVASVIYYVKLDDPEDELPPLEEWQRIEGDRSSATVGDLDSQSLYAICVSAVNKAGTGPPSNPYMIKTSFGVPPQPRDFRGRAESQDRITLEWKPPTVDRVTDMGDSNSTSYVVYTSCDVCEEQEFRMTETKFSYTNLLPNRAYYFRVAAKYASRDGVTSRPITVVTDMAG